MARTAPSAWASDRRRSASGGRRVTSTSRWQRSAASPFRGKLSPWVTGKDIVLELLRRWGAKQSQGMSVELVDADKQLPIAFRNTIANMMAEAEALNGIFAPDEITDAWYRDKGITNLPYPQFRVRRRRALRDRRRRSTSATSRR
jgi:homoaconitase/3-isopropylmalate dehydratase large subunit